MAWRENGTNRRAVVKENPSARTISAWGIEGCQKYGGRTEKEAVCRRGRMEQGLRPRVRPSTTGIGPSHGFTRPNARLPEP